MATKLVDTYCAFGSHRFHAPPGQGTIGSLDYPPEERKKLAKRSITFACEECCPDGSSTIHLLKTREEEQNGDNAQEKLSRAAEAKELAMKMTFKVSNPNNSNIRSILGTIV